MNEIIKSVGRYSIKERNDPFLALIEAVIYQQLNGNAAYSIYGKFINYYHDSVLDPDKILSTDQKTMKSFGLSDRKIEYIRLLSEYVREGNLKIELFSNMTNEEIIDQLTKLKGIGRWTAEMFLIFCLRRLDVFPLKDLGVKKAIQKCYLNSEIPTEQQLTEISKMWIPYRSIATWYLWKSFSYFNTMG